MLQQAHKIKSLAGDIDDIEVEVSLIRVYAFKSLHLLSN
jgi:hypothetical protein